MEICKKEQCTGCCVCSNVCPVEAITMVLSAEGFYVPRIDEQKCINCGKCQKKCPSNNEVKKTKNNPEAYAVKTKDNEAIMRSASGGFFYGLAKHIIENNGVVYGTNHMTCDNDFKPSIICVNNVKDLHNIQGTKYVQSYAGNIYKDVKKNLDNGKKVVFSGTPCQIQALYSYLNGDNENLLTVELICHGVPSVGLFKDYIVDIEKTYNKKVKKVNHRIKDKKFGPLLRINSLIEFEDKKTLIRDYKKDDFLYSFNEHIVLNDVCFDCKYARLPRLADFTIGDFMGIGAIRRSNINISKGISQIIVNTEKAKQCFGLIKNDFDYEVHDIEECKVFNLNIYKPTIKPRVRDLLFSDYKNHGYEFVKNRYIKRGFKTKLALFVREAVRTVFGEKIVVKLMYLKKKLCHEIPSKN